MLKYLVIQLDDTSVSFCHYPTADTAPRMISASDLRKGILFAMKENLNIQFVYPQRSLPDEYLSIIDSIDHTKIKPSTADDTSDADIVVIDGMEHAADVAWGSEQIYILRTGRARMQDIIPLIEHIKHIIKRLNIVITDIDTFTQHDFTTYAEVLHKTGEIVEKEYLAGNAVQINLLTDRMMLTSMNNCNAGHETLTLAPDGQFHICPAFYLESPDESCGDPENGVSIRNAQLYRLDHAPICRRCDSYQCRRCVWLNRHTTLEVNTPSHEQCVAAHIEREASRLTLEGIRRIGEFMPDVTIPEIDYNDPFEKHNNW
ncbi:MAG: CXXX repeat peptide maturase [Alistipes sp.]|nr:CXXX repeat peptide maturase [Alistipes sp.]